MLSNFHRTSRARTWQVAAIAILLSAAVCLASATGQRIHIAPKFTAGESFRYQIDARTSTSGTTISPIQNPQGATEFKQAASLLVRLDVLSVDDAKGSVHIRATYERSHSVSERDAYDPQIDSLDERFNRLEGRSIEFTIGPGGEMTDFKGLDEIFKSRAEAEPVLSWARGLSSGSGFPQEGIAVGQKWSSERPFTGAPLAGLTWRTESAYLRDETCRPSGAKDESCAVIVMRSILSRHGSEHSDATPEDYRHNGLRTSGKWTGSDESLELISIVSGTLVSSTEHGVQDMDYEISSASTGSRIQHTGHVTTDTEIKLLPGSGLRN